MTGPRLRAGQNSQSEVTMTEEKKERPELSSYAEEAVKIYRKVLNGEAPTEEDKIFILKGLTKYAWGFRVRHTHGKWFEGVVGQLAEEGYEVIIVYLLVKKSELSALSDERLYEVIASQFLTFLFRERAEIERQRESIQTAVLGEDEFDIELEEIKHLATTFEDDLRPRKTDEKPREFDHAKLIEWAEEKQAIADLDPEVTLEQAPTPYTTEDCARIEQIQAEIAKEGIDSPEIEWL